jgi:flagellar biosynthesis/type III secretory pathway protein FliH
VIRAAGGPSSRVVPAAVVDAREEARRILDAARAEAEALLAAARAESAEIGELARRLGLESARSELATSLLAAARARDGAMASAEREVQTLALVAAKRIIGEAIALEPARIAEIVGDVLARARRARSIEVRVHPDDLVSLATADLGASVRLTADPEIARGGCVVSSELGTIDARVDVQLEAMAHVLGVERP